MILMVGDCTALCTKLWTLCTWLYCTVHKIVNQILYLTALWTKVTNSRDILLFPILWLKNKTYSNCFIFHRAVVYDALLNIMWGVGGWKLTNSGNSHSQEGLARLKADIWELISCRYKYTNTQIWLKPDICEIIPSSIHSNHTSGPETTSSNTCGN